MDTKRFRQINYAPLHLSDYVITNKLSAKKAAALLIFDDPAYNFTAALPKQTDMDQLDWWTDSQQGLSQWMSSDASVIAIAPIIYPEPVVFLTRTQKNA